MRSEAINRLTQPHTESAAPGNNPLERVEAYLRSRWNFRYNLAGLRTEWRRANSSTPYREMMDSDYNSVWRELQGRRMAVSIDTLRRILASDFCEMYDPYQNYLNGLPEWSGAQDYIGLLADTIQVTPGTEEAWRTCFRKWFVAMVVGWSIEGKANHTALILSGKQGIGKTSWFRTLIPEPLRKYVFAGTLNLKDKDSLVKLSECPLIVMDELENLRGANLDAMKEMITKQAIRLRRAYAYAHETLVRRATFAGSVNSVNFLTDVTGNRRFLCFEAEHIDYQHLVSIDGAVSQALALIGDGFQYWFDQRDVEALNQHNESFREISAEEEVLLTYFEPCLEEDGAHLLKTTELAVQLQTDSGIKLSVQKLGRILQAKGFLRVKRQDRYVYVLKRKSIAE